MLPKRGTVARLARFLRMSRETDGAGGGASHRANAIIAPAAELRGVHKRYVRGSGGVAALENVSFQIGRGERVALVGPSGCGKSTTLNLISGVDRCDSGNISVCGIDITNAPERELNNLRREKIGVVFQQFHLMAHLTVEENVTLPLALAGKRDPARVRELLDWVGLTARMQHFPSELSGGEQQRTAVARALVHRPELLLADEPTGNLDSRSGGAVMELLWKAHREEGSAILLVTHDADVAARADRILHMIDGKIDS